MRLLSAEELRANASFVRGCPAPPESDEDLVRVGTAARLDRVLPACPDCGGRPVFWAREGRPEVVISYAHSARCPISLGLLNT